MRLSDIIRINVNMPRSVNLERDRDSRMLLTNYVVSSKAREVLNRFLDALRGEQISAWSLTGPYGMGKSAFANFLVGLVGRTGDDRGMAMEKLRIADARLHDELLAAISDAGGEQGFFCIPVTAGYEAINMTLARGLRQALCDTGAQCTELIRELDGFIAEKGSESSVVSSCIQQAMSIMRRPLLVVIDEFGKNLEYMAHNHGKGDIFVLQQLSEMKSVYLYVCLHRAFDEYGLGLSMTQRQEWAKIQGRFEDISFVETSPQMLQLMVSAIGPIEHEQNGVPLRKWATEAQHLLDSFGMREDYLSTEQIMALYPIHPFTALVLTEMCRRFAQNDRTLLSFLCSGQRYALSSYLGETEYSGSETMAAMGLDYLYDYFLAESLRSHRAESQRWREISNIVQETGHLSDTRQAIVKTIGLLNLLSGWRGIRADSHTVASVLQYSRNLDPLTVQEEIDSEVKAGRMHIRKSVNEYRLWEGSDFDVSAAIESRKHALSPIALDAILEQYVPLPAVTAARHSIEKGTIRRFERRWVETDNLVEGIVPEPEFDGLVACTFGDVLDFGRLPEICADRRPLLVACLPDKNALRELALDVAATRSVLDDSPELVHDAVARKEARYRSNQAEETFTEYVIRAFSPGTGDAVYYSEGARLEVKSPRDLSKEISRLCDRCYQDCPIIHNEMISYDVLTGAATQARRMLVEAMASSEEREMLGLTGYGPEVAVYKSLLYELGLHCKVEDSDTWEFRLDERQGALWRQLDSIIDLAGEEGLPLDSIYDRLSNPPFGLRRGPAPVFVVLFLIGRADGVAVFQESAYKTYLSASDFALMLKRPDLFVLKRATIREHERPILEGYYRLLEGHIRNDRGLRNSTMLGVAGPLVGLLDSLPSYTQRTRQVSPLAHGVRTSLSDSVDPAELLFKSIPEAVGLGQIDATTDSARYANEIRVRLARAIKELTEAFGELQKAIVNILLEAFEQSDISSLHREIAASVEPLSDARIEGDLKALIMAILRPSATEMDWAMGLASAIVRKPVESWLDQDLDRFRLVLGEYRMRLQQLTTLYTLSGNRLDESKRLFTLSEPNGQSTSWIIDRDVSRNSIEVERKVSEVLALSRENSRAILAMLAERLLAGDSNA